MKNNRHRTDGAFCSPGAQAADPGMPGLRNKLASISFERIAFGVVLGLAAYQSNFRSLVFWSLHPSIPGLVDQIVFEAAGWLLASLLVVWLLLREDNLAIYWRNLSRQPFLLVFLAICALSALWSSAPAITVFRTCVLLTSTMVAAYLGMRCKAEELLRYLSWLGAAVVAASIYMSLTDPLLGINRAYGPAVWRGVFWNKNHLGSLAALVSVVLLLRIADIGFTPRHPAKYFVWLIYAGSLVLVFKSHSAAGYLLTLMLHASVILLLSWLRLAERLRRRHYWLFAAVVILTVALSMGYLDAIFRAFNKDITMTGRTSLWVYLLQDVVSSRPLLGHGFGSLWGDPDFRNRAHEKLGFHPVIGDNGFLDILLGVGAVGLAAFMLSYVAAWRGSINCLVRERSVAGCLPLLVMAFSLFANISFSLLTEIELLVWGLIVAMLFATSERTVPFRCSDSTRLNTRYEAKSPGTA